MSGSSTTSPSYGAKMKNEYEFFKEIGLGSQNLGCYINGVWHGNGPVISSVNPANNQIVVEASVQDYEEGMQACAEVVKMWKQIPALKRGDIVRQIGDAQPNSIILVGLFLSRWEKY